VRWRSSRYKGEEHECFPVVLHANFPTAFTGRADWSSPFVLELGGSSRSGDQARIPLSRKPIIQPVPRGSSLIDKGHLLIRKVVAYMVQQVLLYTACQGSDESLVSTKVPRCSFCLRPVRQNTSYSRGQTSCLSSSASFAQCLLFQALYQALVSRTDIHIQVSGRTVVIDSNVSQPNPFVVSQSNHENPVFTLSGARNDTRG